MTTRHSQKYGLLNRVGDTDDKIKASLPKDAAAELESKCAKKHQPASFLINQLVEEELKAGDQFTVSDFYILLHQGEEKILIKMDTLRSTLSTMSRKEGANFKAANKDAKHRLYVKV
jgi:hypothetical protein